MKLNYAHLEAHLTRQLSAIYMIGGEELLLKQDALNLIRKAGKQKGFCERICITPQTGFDWEALYTLLYSNSLLGEKQFIEFDLRQSLPDKVGSKILQEYSEKPSQDCLLLIHLGKLEDKITKSTWYKALEKAGTLVSIWPISREQLPQWIIQRARKYKLNLNLEAANILADYTEGNLASAAQAIEKLYLYPEKTTIDADLIGTILTDESHFTLFDFLDHLIAGNITRTLSILQNLKNEGTEPAIILWGIARELRILAKLAQDFKNGISYETLFQKHRIFTRRQPLVRHFLSRVTTKNCLKFLTQAAEIDKRIKGASPFNVWEGLELLCLRISANKEIII